MDKSRIVELKREVKIARKELATALGTFSIEFATMESKLNATIHELLGLEPDTGHALTSAIMNISTRLDILATLGRDLPSAEPYREIVQKAVEDAFELNSYRNWLLHDSWAGSTRSNFEPEWKHLKRRMRPKANTRQWQESDFTNSAILARANECRAIARSVLPILIDLSRARNARKQQLEKSA